LLLLLLLLGRVACTECKDAAYCYRLFVYLSVAHNREPYKNG